MIQHEEAEQIALFEWAGWMEHKMPELQNMYHIPNGGLRSKATAARLKAAGVKAGVPDIFLSVARGGYHGLYIEIKYGTNTESKSQKDWRCRLLSQGYQVKVCYGCGEAIKEIELYLRK